MQIGKRGTFFLITASYVHMLSREYIFGEIKKLIQFIIDAHEETLN
jgi:hypothetical protein